MNDEMLRQLLERLNRNLAISREDLTRQHKMYAEYQERNWPGAGEEFAEGTRKCGEAVRLALAETSGAVARWCEDAAHDPKALVPVEGGAALSWVAETLRQHMPDTSSSDT